MPDRPIEQLLERDSWKSFGAVSTPPAIVQLMLELAEMESWQGLSILEPGAGFCEFLQRIQALHPNNHFAGIELNPEIFQIAASSYKSFQLIPADFLLWDSRQKFDLVIGNPPYGIIGDKSHYPIHGLEQCKKTYQNIFQTWRGKYNIYGAFIEKAVRLLKPRGKLVFIVPATFMLLDDFSRLRQFLAEQGRTRIYYLGPGVFEKKQVSTAILVLDKGGKGIELFQRDASGRIRKCFAREKYDGGIIRFESSDTLAFEKGKIPLGQIFFIRFAARSPEIKKHPLAATRPGPGLVPVLTGSSLHPGWIDYDNTRSGIFFPLARASELRKFYGQRHIVVGHTKGGKVVAAIDERCYPWREEMHLVPKKPGLNLEAVVGYLNSSELQAYMKNLYREITPHLTITQLKLLPLPQNLAGDF